MKKLQVGILLVKYLTQNQNKDPIKGTRDLDLKGI